MDNKKLEQEESKEKTSVPKQLKQKAITTGMVLSGIWAYKMAYDGSKQELMRSKGLLDEVKQNIDKSGLYAEPGKFPVLPDEKKTIILNRLWISYYIFALLLVIMPFAAWQSVSHGFYSPILGCIAFSIISIAKLAEYSFFSHQLQKNQFIEFSAWRKTPSAWIPKKAWK